MKKINTLNSVIQTTEGRKNLGITQSMLPRSFAPLWMTVMMVLAFTACSEEDIMQPANGQSGSLHISSVIIDGQQVARSRVEAENGAIYNINELPYNHSITKFSDGDVFKLDYKFEESGSFSTANATFNGSIWTLSVPETMPVTEESTFIIKPGDGEKWADIKMKALVKPASAGPMSLGRQAEGRSTTPEYVLGNFSEQDVMQVNDCLYASTDDESIIVDTNLNSPTLGAVTIQFKHQDALLRLPMTTEALNVAPGNYIVDGIAYNVTDLATLWAYLDGDNFDYYVPFTQVGNNLQAIVYDTYYTLAGFKAVLYTTASGNPGDVNYNESEVLTLDLPFKVGGSASPGIVLEENTQYPLTLNISPASAEVNFTIPNGKPGWGATEEELSNAENEWDLKYVVGENGSAGTFMVKTAAGLQHLNEWMAGTKSTSDFKAIGFAGNQDIAAEAGSPEALAMNITFMANITLDAPATTGESNWTAIGTSGTPYTGTFDGNGHTITGMVINATTGGQGFVGYLDEGGQIKNLTFEDAQVASTEGRNVGIVAGVNNGMVDNCHTVGTSSVNAKGYVGGIVGRNENVITNCTNVAQVAATSESVGGITGDNYGGFVSSCINSGSVIGTRFVGGIAGSQFWGEVIACGNTGSVRGVEQVGGIVGQNDEGSNAIASWTKDIEEKDENGETPDLEDGVGLDEGTSNDCYSVADAADCNSKVDDMNIALLDYYDTNDTNYYWTPGTNDGWPTLTTEKPTIMPR